MGSRAGAAGGTGTRMGDAPARTGSTGTKNTPTGNTYDKYGSANVIERALMAGFFRSLEASLPMAAPATVLEVGAGEGEVLARVKHRYPAAQVVGLDLHDVDLAEEWRTRRLHGTFASADALPFPDDTFDLVLAIEVLEHVGHPDQALAEIARVGRGDVVLSVPLEPLWRVLNVARGKYVGDLGNTPGHIQHWTPKGFTALVADHLRVVEARHPLPWTMVHARTR